MSEDASYEVQRAIFELLTNAPDVVALVDRRVYDRVDANVTFPYISFGPEQEIPEDIDCIDASEIFLQIDIWSTDPGYREAKRIAGAVEKALHDSDLQLQDNAMVYIACNGRRMMRDPDGLTSHAVLTFRAGVEKH